MDKIKEVALNLIVAFLVWLPVIIAFEYAYN